MIDRDKFFPVIRNTAFPGKMAQSQVDGIDAILDAWVKFQPYADLRWVAYALATAYRETAATMQPIGEYGHGRGHSYGLPAGPFGKCYYGRGLVQLTWESNYQKATTRLHAIAALPANESLIENPELALQPDIAAAIMIDGMSQGWFTGAKLGDYFSLSVDDPVNARRIINGVDHASEIAVYHDQFLNALSA